MTTTKRRRTGQRIGLRSRNFCLALALAAALSFLVVALSLRNSTPPSRQLRFAALGTGQQRRVERSTAHVRRAPPRPAFVVVVGAAADATVATVDVRAILGAMPPEWDAVVCVPRAAEALCGHLPHCAVSSDAWPASAIVGHSTIVVFHISGASRDAAEEEGQRAVAFVSTAIEWAHMRTGALVTVATTSSAEHAPAVVSLWGVKVAHRIEAAHLAPCEQALWSGALSSTSAVVHPALRCIDPLRTLSRRISGGVDDGLFALVISHSAAPLDEATSLLRRSGASACDEGGAAHHALGVLVEVASRARTTLARVDPNFAHRPPLGAWAAGEGLVSSGTAAGLGTVERAAPHHFAIAVECDARMTERRSVEWDFDRFGR